MKKPQINPDNASTAALWYPPCCKHLSPPSKDNKKVSSWHTITGIFNHVFYNDCGQVVAVPFLSFDTVWELFWFFWGGFSLFVKVKTRTYTQKLQDCYAPIFLVARCAVALHKNLFHQADPLAVRQWDRMFSQLTSPEVRIYFSPTTTTIPI